MDGMVDKKDLSGNKNMRKCEESPAFAYKSKKY